MFNEKDLAQEQALKKWVQNKYRGTISASVGFGKTKVAIDAMKEFPGKWLIVAPTHTILSNWSNELEKWKMPSANIDKICYASLAKTHLNKYDGIVLDEIHRSTINNTANFDQISPLCAIIGLTGTEPVERDKKDFIEEYCPIVFKYDVNKAVDKGLVSDYRIHCISVTLDDEIKYIKGGNKQKRFYVTEQRSYKFINGVVENNKKEYDELNEKYNELIEKSTIMKDIDFMGNFTKDQNYIKHKIKSIKKKLEYSYIKRKQTVNNFYSKLFASQYVLNKVREKDEKVAIFTPTIEQAETISNYTYHSKTNEDHLNLFKEGKIKELATVNALNEGVSVPGIECGIIFCLNSKDRDFIQRLGRILRRNDGKPANLYVIYLENTIEERYLRNSVESLDPEKVLYYTYEEFKQGKSGLKKMPQKEKVQDLFVM